MMTPEFCKLINYCVAYFKYDIPVMCDGRCNNLKDRIEFVENTSVDEDLVDKIQKYKHLIK